MTREFDAGDSPVRVGRGESDDFRLSSGTVSRSHLVFTHAHRQWRATDSASSNGTYDEHGIRLHEVDVLDRVVFRIGHPDDGELLEVCVLGEENAEQCTETGSQGATTVIVSPADLRLAKNRDGRNQTISIGRSDENEICVDDLSVSRRHATIRSIATGVAAIEKGSRQSPWRRR